MCWLRALQALHCLPRVEELDLEDQDLIVLPERLWSDTRRVSVLRLGGNRLEDLPSRVGELAALRKLYLGANRLDALPPELGALQHLRLLDLHGNRLRTLPPAVCGLARLQYLNLDANALRTLPPEVGALGALLVLSVNANPLESLPPQLGALNTLHELYAFETRLRALPAELGALPLLGWRLDRPLHQLVPIAQALHARRRSRAAIRADARYGAWVLRWICDRLGWRLPRHVVAAIVRLLCA